MKQIGIRELSAHTSQVVRSVREAKETYEVTHRGQVVARLVPVTREETDEEIEEWIVDWAHLTREIADASGPEPVDAVQLVHEQRRDL